jgi:hypothetical protein
VSKKRVKEEKEMPLGRKVLFLFALFFSVRVCMSLVYLSLYGSHTTPITETYFYYGVANGRLALEPYDVTGWILKFVAYIFHGESLLYGVFLTGSLISSLTALLVFFFVKDMIDEKAALVASILYGFLMEPLSMGVLLFTHDLVQMPFLITFLWCVWTALKRRKVVWAAAAILFFLSATRINATIFIALEIAFVAVILHSLEKKERLYAYVFYALSVLLIFSLGSFLFGAADKFIPSILRLLSLASRYDYGSLLATYHSGTADFTPPSLNAYWTRYNVFLFILPPSLYSSFKRRDSLPLAVFFPAAISSLFFDRASRVLDLGMALLLFNYIISEKARAHSLPILAFGAVTTVLVWVMGRGSFLFLSTPLAILLIWTISSRRRECEPRILGAGFLLTNILFFFLVTGAPLITEAEYASYRYLEGGKGLVLQDWGRGFAIEAVSGLSSEASPANLSTLYQEVLMKGEEAACEEMRGRRIRYVVVTTQYFKLMGGEVAVSDFFLKHYNGRLEDLSETLLFHMLYDEGRVSCLTKVFERRDMATNAIVKVFEIKMTPDFHLRDYDLGLSYEVTTTIKLIEKVI